MSAWGTDPCGHDYGSPSRHRFDREQRLDYGITTPALLLQQYRDRVRMVATLRVMLSEVQRIETAAWEVIVWRRLGLAFGAGLEQLGAIVGASRGNAASDDDYLTAIRARIAALRSAGREPELALVIKLSVPDGVTWEHVEDYFAGMLIDFPVAAADYWLDVLRFVLLHAKAGGVRIGLVYSYDDPSIWFRFSDSLIDDETFDAPHGFRFGGAGGVLRYQEML